MARTCAGCDTEITPGPRERNKRKWCSESCRVRAHRVANPDMYARWRADALAKAAQLARLAKCQACGGSCFNGADYCNSPECQKVRGRLASRKAYATDRERIKKRVRLRRQNETPEQREARLEKDRARTAARGYTESARASSARRRARKLGATVEKFNHIEIFERDGWVCGICLEPVDRSLSWPDPQSVSLDHVVPLSLGGEHSRANVRCSHLNCNVLRGAARTDAPQPALLL